MPGRQDRDRADRLRRRPGQRGTRRADPGSDGHPAEELEHYCEPAHAVVYTPPDSPDMPRLREMQTVMYRDLYGQLTQIRESPRPGLIDALIRATINGKTPPDMELLGVMMLFIGGG